MILRTCDIGEFMNRCKQKEVVCYGAGNWLSILSDELNVNIEDVYSYAVDSNPNLWGTKQRAGKRFVDVRSPEYLYNNIHDNTVILITSGEYYDEIYATLNGNKTLSCVECYTVIFLQREEIDRRIYNVAPVPADFRMNDEPVIPKVIHYTWLSGDPLPDNAKKCLESWKKFAPDYEIREWNSSNYDLSSHPYVAEAVKKHKWGFAGDYVRLDVVYKYGGFYFDLDVELLRGIDELRFNSAFCSFESDRHINLGSGFGAQKGHSVIRKLRDFYDDVSFLHPDGTLNLQASPVYQTLVFKQLGANINTQFQVIEDCAIYPLIYFVPKALVSKRFHKSDLSYSIHHFAGSWFTEEEWDLLKSNKKYSMYKLALSNEQVDI